MKIRLKDTENEFKVFDLSRKGFCLETGYFSHDFSPPKEHDATIDLGGGVIKIRLQTIYQNGNYIGCKVIEGTAHWIKEASEILDPLLVGHKLHEIDPQFVKQDTPGQIFHWYQSGPTCDLFIWTDQGGKTTHIQLFFARQVVEWTPQIGLCTGQIEEPPAETQHPYPRSKLYALDAQNNPETIKIARLLIGASKIPDHIIKPLNPYSKS